jgi:hypothetical protein
MAPDVAAFPPRVLLVMPDQWPRALLRAALREAGYDALGAPGLSGALRYRPSVPDRGPVGLAVVDQAALGAEGATAQLDALLRRHPGAMPVLLARATMPEPSTEQPRWRTVIRRPASIAEIVATVAGLLPLSPDAGRPLD